MFKIVNIPDIGDKYEWCNTLPPEYTHCGFEGTFLLALEEMVPVSDWEWIK